LLKRLAHFFVDAKTCVPKECAIIKKLTCVRAISSSRYSLTLFHTFSELWKTFHAGQVFFREMKTFRADLTKESLLLGRGYKINNFKNAFFAFLLYHSACRKTILGPNLPAYAMWRQ